MAQITSKTPRSIIPEYSLTGDLLSYLKCPLQYRYYNRAALPPSTPVQLWFGEFIHGIMEESYKRWNNTPDQYHRFPWDWLTDIRPIELSIDRRLKARGLSPPPHNFCPYNEAYTRNGLCGDSNHPHKLLASERACEAINTWGQHLFPLVDKVEEKLKSTRNIENYDPRIHRSRYYSITGIVDVISSVKINKAPEGNLILHYVHQHPEIQHVIDEQGLEEYEIIIDYKGMRRPPLPDGSNLDWNYHKWQILTYAWLRSRNPEAKPVVAGILFYLNELAYSVEGMQEFQQEINDGSTDILPTGVDKQSIIKWATHKRKDKNRIPDLSRQLKEKRSIRIIPVHRYDIDDSLNEFNEIVNRIEDAVIREKAGSGLNECWAPNPVVKTCTACDFKYFCRSPDGQHPAGGPYSPQVP